MIYLAFAMLFAITAAPAPEPEPVWLDIDCEAGTTPFIVGLPDDVAIGECEPTASTFK